MEFNFENESEPELPGFETNTGSEESSDPLFNQQSLEESLASLYKPPYPQQRPQESIMPEEPSKPEAPSFPENQSSLLSSYEEPAPIAPAPQAAAIDTKKSELFPLLLLALGANLLTLGLLLFFFSDNGTLTLEWNASKWFIYCLTSLPLVYFGLKTIRRSQSD